MALVTYNIMMTFCCTAVRMYPAWTHSISKPKFFVYTELSTRHTGIAWVLRDSFLECTSKITVIIHFVTLTYISGFYIVFIITWWTRMWFFSFFVFNFLMTGTIFASCNLLFHFFSIFYKISFLGVAVKISDTLLLASYCVYILMCLVWG